MKFSDIIGQSETVDTLRTFVDNNKIPHAILLSGKSGIGKTRIARAFTQYLHCKNRINGDSCGKCPSCLQHQHLNNPDTHFIFPIKKTESILVSKDRLEEWVEMLAKNDYMPPELWNDILNAGNAQPGIYVNESEDIINRASISALQENFKVFIIWLPERLRPEAANKLLKIIEEPFEDTVFIMISNEPQKILPTILSRLSHLQVKPLKSESISQFLISEKKIDTANAENISKLAAGSMIKALNIADNATENSDFTDYFISLMRTAYSLQGKKMKEVSESLASFGREKLIRFLDYSCEMIRENFIYNLNLPSLNMLKGKEEEFSKKFSPFVNSSNVEELLEIFSKASIDISKNANSKIVMFDTLFLISRSLRKPTK